MLVGEPPFIGNTTPALLVKHLAEMPVPVSQRRQDVPPDLARIVMRLLEKAPEHRFQSAGEMLQAIKSGIVPPTPMPERTASSPAPITFNGAPIGGMRVDQPGSDSRGYSAPAYSSRTGIASQVPTPLVGGVGGPSSLAQTYAPGLEERARWDAKPVRDFRKKLGPYLFVNFAILFLGIFGSRDFLGVTTVWTVYIAWKYAKLWSDGYDWHDVLRQPKDRMLGEVISDSMDHVHATFSRKKREEMRATGQYNNNLLRGALSPSAPTPAGGSMSVKAEKRGKRGKGETGAPLPVAPVRDDALGEYVSVVRRAREDREEIGRLLGTIPSAERGRIPDVASTAVELVNRIESMAVDLAQTDSTFGPERARAIDSEIATLEGEANPLDTSKSEARVRRLAQLRRDRRAVADVEQKRAARQAQMESWPARARKRAARSRAPAYRQQLGAECDADRGAGDGARA
jgi:serine/threonine-protein kinase